MRYQDLLFQTGIVGEILQVYVVNLVTLIYKYHPRIGIMYHLQF